jgi:hypothetical protein
MLPDACWSETLKWCILVGRACKLDAFVQFNLNHNVVSVAWFQTFNVPWFNPIIYSFAEVQSKQLRAKTFLITTWTENQHWKHIHFSWEILFGKIVGILILLLSVLSCWCTLCVTLSWEVTFLYMFILLAWLGAWHISFFTKNDSENEWF